MAGAQDATHASAARVLFAEGVAAADTADWATAAERFRRAGTLRSSPTIALNLAIALGHLGQVVEAAELLRGVQRDPGSSPDVRQAAAQNLIDLEPRIARVRLVVEGPLEGATLVADAHTLSELLVGTEVPVDPGAHHFAVLRDGAEVVGADVSLIEGGRDEVRLVVPPVPEPVIAEPVTEAPVIEEPLPPPSGPDPVVLGLGIGGGVVVLGGVLTLVLVLALPSEAMPFVGNAGILEIGR